MISSFTHCLDCGVEWSKHGTSCQKGSEVLAVLDGAIISDAKAREAEMAELRAQLADAEKVVEVMRRIARGGYTGASYLAGEALAAYDKAKAE